MNIPVVVVDNAETDRYIARRRFARSEGFGDIREYQSGTEFIQDFDVETLTDANKDAPIVVMMDISMPGKDGFQVIDEFRKRERNNSKASNLVFMVYTSSNAIIDREQAASMKSVKGYFLKPLRKQDIEHIRELVG